MPIFEIKGIEIKKIKPIEFKIEKDLQKLVEKNLETIFNCKLVASEFSTGNIHSGRIDTLALSEDYNPVIIEYKKHASSDLINQSLYYLHWIRDHKGDFQIVVNKSFNQNVEIDWSDIRVICLAPEFKKYDLHAVQVMGANIELWQYKIYENGILNIEEIYRKAEAITHSEPDVMKKNPIMVEAGRKAAITRKTGEYTVEQHSNKLNKNLNELFNEIRDYIINLDSSIEEKPKKQYIAYKTTQNFVCLETKRDKVILFLKLNPDEINPFPVQGRDVRSIGHYGTGDFQFTIKSINDFEESKYLVKNSLKNIGG